MKVSLNWLTDYVDVSISAHQLGDLLTNIGLNCDGIDDVGDDIVYTLDVTSNRPDWLGHLGVARELAAATGLTFKPPAMAPLPTSGRASDLARVQVLDADLCPRYTARVIRGVKVGPSPDWMVQRLSAVGMRSINNIVDVTNYVLMEYSQPLHSFDYDKLADHAIVVRRARDGEVMTAIDGTTCKLTPNMLVIADAARPVAIAGVMGGLDTEVAAGTVNVLIESAQFDQLTTRRTSRKLGLMSESNYRFERGIDPVGIDAASMRACQLIIELAGGTLAEGMVDVWAKPYAAAVVQLRPERTNALLGIDVPTERQVELLGGLGLAPKVEGGRILCTIPPHRRDLTREIDLIEEVARLHGYDKIPVGGTVTHAVRGESLPQSTRKRVCTVLQSAGYDEAVTFTFIDPPEAQLFGEQSPLRTDPLVRKSNNVLRPTLLPSLLRACKVNQDAGNLDYSLFEVASVFPPGKAGQLPREYIEIGLVSMKSAAETGQAAKDEPLQHLRGVIETLVADVTGLDVELRPAGAGSAAGLAESAAACILLDGKEIGVAGMVAQSVRDYYGLEKDLVAARLHFEPLLERAGKVRTYRPIPRLPAVRRDLSLIVDEPVTWQQLADVVASVPQPLRTGLQYVTTYRGKPVPAGRKSVTVTLVYRSTEGTLRSEQVDEQVRQIVDAAAARLSAQLRT